MMYTKVMKIIINILIKYIKICIGIFDKIFTYSGKIPSLLLLCIYILMVFAFAKIYASMPANSFYHSTSKFEYKNFNSDADSILACIKKEITKTYKEYYKKGINRFDGWLIDIDKLDVYILDLKNFPKEIYFTINFSTTYETFDNNPIHNYVSYTIRMPIYERIIIGDTLYSIITRDSSGFTNQGDLSDVPDIKVLFPFNSENFLPEITVFPISLELYYDIVSIGEGFRGFPSEVSGHFGRMLYFSAGIATSSTFGDIVPLTQTARNTVTIESIQMIILIGLFLNALVNDLTRTVLSKIIKNDRSK